MQNPNITMSRWSLLGNLPAGIEFDEVNGAFSGTPEEPGEFVVPVSVETNYGTDQKDIRIIIEGTPKTVYAIGNKASVWSGGAEPDAQGFYELSMPKAYKLLEHQSGFGAKTEGGKYYFCGVKELVDVRSGEASQMLSYASTPQYLTVGDNNVDEVRVITMKNYTYTIRNTQTGVKDSWTYNGYCMLIRYASTKAALYSSNVRFYYKYEQNNTSDTTWFYDTKFLGTYKSSVKALPEAMTPVVNLLTGVNMIANGSEVWRLFFSGGDKKWYLDKKEDLDFNVKKLFLPYEYELNGGCSAKKSLFSYLSENNLLDNDPDNFTLGVIKDAWVYMTVAYVLTEDNNLYEKKGTASWQHLGYFDVKKLLLLSKTAMLILTRDGRLFHKGSALSGVAEAHTNITQIFTDTYIYDFTYGNSTLTVLRD